MTVLELFNSFTDYFDICYTCSEQGQRKYIYVMEHGNPKPSLYQKFEEEYGEYYVKEWEYNARENQLTLEIEPPEEDEE